LFCFWEYPSYSSLFFLFRFFISACGLYTPRHYTWYKDYKGIKRIGYTVQAGAFTEIENAVELAERLDREGIEAFYYRHESGLYKVRFGDYATEDSAKLHAERLRKWNILNDYYVVRPEELAIAKDEVAGGKTIRDEIVRTARSFLDIPYRWGGESPDDGFDCSGLTMAVYEYNGLKIPRTSRAQFRAGSPVEKSDLKKGDLVFFATGLSSRVSHVGIYIGYGKFIHAPGRGKTIRTDSLSSEYYSKTYAGSRSYL